MLCGVRFCGGCNPRFDRGAALKKIKNHFEDDDVEFVNALEGVPHDLMLVIGGCTNCCAAYEQFDSKNGTIKMWDESQIKKVLEKIEENE